MYIANNPIKYIDPNGMILVGVSRSNAAKLHDDLNVIFANKKFDAFRNLISRTDKIILMQSEQII